MRKKIVAGNWKMNTNLQEGVGLAQEINKLSADTCESTRIVIAPPYVHLTEVAKVINSDRICLAAQNCAAEEKGAYTGEVAPGMLKSAGVKAVILGHSERRAYFGENNQLLNKKVKLALDNELIPIFCCGEQLEEREADKQFEVVEQQIEEALFDLPVEKFGTIVIAYEPVWAIGTGKTATPEQAQEMHAFIRKTVASKYGEEVADNTTILYGGSCKPANAEDLFANKDVDGGLIGGASLKAQDFIAIINAMKCEKCE